MYFPVGWPRVLQLPELGQTVLKQVTCNRDRILFAVLTDDSLGVWFCNPCVPIVFHRRTADSTEKIGTNVLVEWKPDSSMLVVATSEGNLLFYNVSVSAEQKGLYNQTDSPHANLRRDSAELFIKETIPALHLSIGLECMVFDGSITSIACITMTEIMISTSNGHVLRYKWDGTQNRDYNLDLRRIPFCINQQVSKAVPIVEENTYIVSMEYSPLIGGFSVTLNDGRSAFLTASSLKFDPNQVQGIWAQGIEDATCAAVNHRYRLITFGRMSSECDVYCVDESTGGLELSHRCILSSKDYPGCPGGVSQVCWSPDGCTMAVSWINGGIGIWSTFGALLMCSLAWDYGLHVDLEKNNPLHVSCMEWSTEGYQLWMIRKQTKEESDKKSIDYSLLQLDFVKSVLTINPCMSQQTHLFLQGADRLYINTASTLIKLFSYRNSKEEGVFADSGAFNSTNVLAEGRQWLVVPVPSTYSSTNWPIRYAAIDHLGQNVAVAGRNGLAHYSMITRRWKLFGNETQEKDFVVMGGLLWWRDYIVLGCYSIIDNQDEIRFYPRDSKLDNKFAKIVKMNAPVLLINNLQNHLITFESDAQVSIWNVKQIDTVGGVEVNRVHVVDISALCVHPACVTSLTLTSLRTETGRGQNSLSESIVLNVSGRLLLVQRESTKGDKYICSMPTVLASCVENVWVPSKRKADKVHLTEALWLFCGSHGMRVWLPLFPKDGDKPHTFMSKRIMLPFHLQIYPLAILFEDAIILGAANDTLLYSSDTTSLFSLPFSVLERTSQVYLHQILRQLIRRNLGFHAWEIARSCNSLPYFPHSLELLLHEVLEEEATCKDPIPDAQLPSVIEFIMEFPVYLQTVVQCARKTEIALWPYLFSVAGKPKDLFQECMESGQLDIAASYLIILQNLETPLISRQHAKLLLLTALEKSKWELAKDLVRFLRAIDPNDVESPRTSFTLPGKLGMSPQTPPVPSNADDLSLILGNVQGARGRSFSTSIAPKLPEKFAGNSNESPGVAKRKKSVPSNSATKNDVINKEASDEIFIDEILQKHACTLLSARRLVDLGYFAAHLDFHLVTWLVKERDQAGRIDDFVATLKLLHQQFNWPYPTPAELPNFTTLSTPLEDHLKSLQVDEVPVASSRVGDSGYVSFPGPTPCYNFDLHSQIAESESETLRDEVFVNGNKNELRKRGNEMDDSNMSVVSSVWAEEYDVEGSTNWEVPTPQILDQLSDESSRGSHRSEVQLRYLMQLFMEASCLEWSLLISILLRDAMAVLRTVNAARSTDQSIESVFRLKRGLQFLIYWTNRECLGYKTFMLAIQNQVSVLSKILKTKVQQRQINEHQQAVSATLSKISTPLSTRSRKTSSNQDALSQSSSGREKVNSVTGSDRIIDIASATADNANDSIRNDGSIIPESTGCIVS